MKKYALLGGTILAGVILWSSCPIAPGTHFALAQQQSPDTSHQPPGKDGKPPARPGTTTAPSGKPAAPPAPAPGGQRPPVAQGGAGQPAAPAPQHVVPGQPHPGQPGSPAVPGQPHPAAGAGQPHPPGAPGQAQSPATPPQQGPAAGTPGQPQHPAGGAAPHPPATAAQPHPLGTPAAPGQVQSPATPPQQGPAAATPGQPQHPAGGATPHPAAGAAQPRPPGTPGTPGQAGAAPPPAGQPRPPTAAIALPPPPAAAQGQAPKPVALVGHAVPAPIGASGQPLRKVDDLRKERKVVVEGGRTIIREPDRTIIRENGQAIIQHSEVDRFRYNARDVVVQRQGNNNVTIIERPGGIKIINVVDLDGRLIRRVRRDPTGREIIIIDNRPEGVWRPDSYFVELPPPVIRIPRERYILETASAAAADIFAVLTEPPVERIERRYSLDEIRYSETLRERMPRIDIDTVNFESGSWEVTPDQVDRLALVAQSINRIIDRNPSETFLVEGYTDAVGSDDDNLSLSDRRAESVAVLLTNQFQVPPENLSSQGYGKQFLKIPTDGPERANRRVAIRRITPLLMGQN